MAASAASALNALFDLSASHRVTAVIYTAARLGIADILLDEPRSVTALAREAGADERSLARLMTALVTVGICRQDGDRFELTDIGRPLAAQAHPSLKAWAIFEGHCLQRWWGGLLDSVRTGKAMPELEGLADNFELMARDPEDVAVFNNAMVSLTRMIVPDVIGAYDFSGIDMLMDVGGGFGELLVSILKAYPDMQGAIFDLPRCADGAQRQFDRAGLDGRATFIAGDFFEKVPRGADAMVLKSIIHDWSDEPSIDILRNCRAALPDKGKLLLVERLMPEEPTDDAEDQALAMSDLNMLRHGGAERTAREYGELLAAGGFRLTRTVPAGRFNVIEARPM